ncbi:YbhN family protein [Actinoplanes sp. NPDC051343]|uniref:YbhN family protein n=1 Tax=Actinoplanes sp. NPDC051343 TaxID=3363906 RepID=UPI00378FFD5B
MKNKWVRYAGIAAVLALLTTELVLGWSSLSGALRQLRAPHIGWLALAVAAELTAMSAYAHMQRRLLRSAGVRASSLDHVRLAYAAHSLNETLPGGPAFSTRLNYQQMRRFGASPAIASWAIALSGILSSAALAAITVGGALWAGGTTHWSHFLVLAGAAVLLVIGVRHVTRHPAAVQAPLAALNRLRRRPAADGLERIAGFLDQLRAARLRPAHGVAAAALALLNWLLDAACLWLCFQAVGESPAPSATTVLAFCAAMAAGSLTIVPGGLGIVDSALIFGLIAGGVAAPAAVATVVLYRVISFGFIMSLGWIFWLQIRLRAAGPAAPVRREATAGPRTSVRRLAACPKHLAVVGASPAGDVVATAMMAASVADLAAASSAGELVVPVSPVGLVVPVSAGSPGAPASVADLVAASSAGDLVVPSSLADLGAVSAADGLGAFSTARDPADSASDDGASPAGDGPSATGNSRAGV